jgi:lipid-A-disaccharide synthase
MARLLISAAEPSGDRLAAELIGALRAHGSFTAHGLAGPLMRQAGVEPLAAMEDVSVMGLAEVLRHLGTVRRVRSRMLDAVKEGADALIVIDGPDLHLPIARAARRAGIPAIGVVCPQVWAWRAGRVRAISRDLDHLLCLLSFEPALFGVPGVREGFSVEWVGHPVLDRVPARGQVDPALYGLLPGSRDQEIRRHLSVFLATAERVRAAHPGARFRMVCPVSVPALPGWIERVEDIGALSSARAALTKSGTVTVELAAMGVPQVVAHRVHPLTYWLGRLLVRGVSHIALPNVLAELGVDPGAAPVVPEYIQDLDPDILAGELLRLPQQQRVLLEPLGRPGAAARAAVAVARVMGLDQSSSVDV